MKKFISTGPQPTLEGQKTINNFLNHLQVSGYDPKTIKTVKDIIWAYWKFIEYKDLRTNFNKDIAESYKNSLKGKISSNVQKCDAVADFYEYLFDNPELYPDILQGILVLKPNKNEKVLLASDKNIQEYLTLEDFDKLIDFDVKNIIDQRDKALLCFLLLSAARINVVRGALIGAFNIETLDFIHNPQNTKRGKFISSVFFNINKKYENIVIDWIKYLIEQGFTDNDPIFPIIDKDHKDLSKLVLTKKLYQSKNAISRIIKQRYDNAHLKAYSAHKFRHLATDIAMRHVRTGWQLKAVSQNLGHNSVATLFRSYANMEPAEYKKIIRNLKPVPLKDKMLSECSRSEIYEWLQELEKYNSGVPLN